MKYRAVIFDLDGTLIDSQAGITKGFQKALAAYGVSESLENIKALIGPPLAKTIITKYGFTPEDGAAAMRICKDYQTGEGLDEVRLYGGITELLGALRKLGIRLAVATNKPDTTAWLQLRRFGLAAYFDDIETNNADQTRGTKKDFIRLALAALGTAPNAALMVGDRADDVSAGASLGLDTAGALYGYGSREELLGAGAGKLAERPGDILTIVQDS